MSARRPGAPGGWAPAPDPARRYARPRTRQLRTRDGRGCWIYRVACGCGWQRHEAGWRAALAAGDAHWHAEHRAAWRRPARAPSPWFLPGRHGRRPPDPSRHTKER